MSGKHQEPQTRGDYWCMGHSPKAGNRHTLQRDYVRKAYMCAMTWAVGKSVKTQAELSRVLPAETTAGKRGAVAAMRPMVSTCIVVEVGHCVVQSHSKQRLGQRNTVWQP